MVFISALMNIREEEDKEGSGKTGKKVS